MKLNEARVLKLAGLLKEVEDNSDDLKKYYKSDYIRVYTIDMNYGQDKGTVGVLKVDISWFEVLPSGNHIGFNENGKSEMKKIFPNYDIDFRFEFLSQAEYNKHIQKYQTQIDNIKKMIKLASANPKKFK